MPTQDELRQLLNELIEERKKKNPGETLNQFGQALGYLVSKEHVGFSKQHLTLWKTGKARISDEAARALVAMAGRVFDETSEIQARARTAEITVFAPVPRGTMYDGPIRNCKDPACGQPYIPVNYFQRYCPVCREQRKNAKRR